MSVILLTYSLQYILIYLLFVSEQIAFVCVSVYTINCIGADYVHNQMQY